MWKSKNPVELKLLAFFYWSTIYCLHPSDGKYEEIWSPVTGFSFTLEIGLASKNMQTRLPRTIQKQPELVLKSILTSGPYAMGQQLVPSSFCPLGAFRHTCLHVPFAQLCEIS